MRLFSSALFLLLLLIAFPSHASSLDTIKCSIQWLPSIPSWLPADSASGKTFFNFENAKHNVDGIPVFSKLLPTYDNNSGVKVHIISLSYDTIPITNQYARWEELPEEISFSTTILKEEKKNFVQISAIPIVRKGDKLLLLKEFTAQLIKTPYYSTKKYATGRWKTSSVLSTGTWKKIAVSKTGIYKLSYTEIKNLGFSNPSEIRIYGNGGAMLPEKYQENQADDLREIPLYFSKGSDGTFNEGDFILFFASGPVAWSYDSINKKFVHSKHYYTNKTCYFLTAGQGGAQLPDNLAIGTPEDMSVRSFVDYDVHEENTYNIIKSGRNWVGERFSLQPTRTISFSFPDPLENGNMSIEGEVLARSGINTAYSLRYNNQVLLTQNMSRVYINDETSNYADSRTFIAQSKVTAKDVGISLTFGNNGDNTAEGWLSFLRVNVNRKLNFGGDQLLFRDTSALYQNKTVLYTIDNGNSGLLLWEVTDLNHPKNIHYNMSGQQISFKALTDTLRSFVLFDPAKVLAPDLLNTEENTVPNQDLHAASKVQMVIIAHKTILAEAEELAEIHRSNDNLNVMVVTPGQLYNEFSSGNPDPAAYRNFMKMLYDKASKPEELPRYLLLMGDGSYKNFSFDDESNKGNTNLILTYQSANSIRPVNSYVSDDYFGLLDDNESIELGLLDVGIGRFPVTTPAQAKAIVNKIKKYISASSIGNWRNNICFLADDEDGNTHMSQADQISTYMGINFPSYNLIKLYTDAYPQVTTSAGPRYPEVNKAIENTLNRGVLIMNYTGHGGKESLAHEQIVKHEEVKSWSNSFYPLFITATCEFSRFDDYEIVTAGEDVLLNEKGGGIALLTTTRLVYSGPNFILNQEFYKNFSGKDTAGNTYRLGDLLRRTKNTSGTDINKLCFTLLGDPALTLAYPKLKVQTNQINAHPVGSASDTLKAYQEVTIKGTITDQAGIPSTNFNGIVYPSLYDKEQTVKTLNNDNGDPFVYKQQESLLYKGKATVKNGEFEFSFVVPREIAYNYGNGKLSYYAASDNNMDASGLFTQFIIGGIAKETSADNAGPLINLYLNDESFVNGGISNPFPTLLASLSDDNGINISGTGVGHNIICIIDNNTAGALVLNNYFESETDNYRKGSINYKLPRLDAGTHTLSLKAWDIFNNSSTAEIVFEVADTSSLAIKNLHNYPNPFTQNTTFMFEHNQPGKMLNAELQIFSITGTMIARENMQIYSDGFTSGPIPWEGEKNYFKKLDKGIYIYRFLFRYNGSEIVSESKKMVVSE